MGKKLDTRAIGLDVGLSFIRWLTGAENLHYGLWTDLDVSAGNLRAAQDNYSTKLFQLLPSKPCRILDIGGGAGETAKKLIALGHHVDIVVPSAFLAERCRKNAPEANIHECTFEVFKADEQFDICLFSESYQYIPLNIGLSKALGMITPDGAVVIADCFRTDAYKGRAHDGPKPGGGHHLSDFRKMVEGSPVSTTFEEDITEAVAPSIDLEQGFFNVVGHGITRIDTEAAEKKPGVRWVITRLIRLFLPAKNRTQLMERLTKAARTSDAFKTYNRYLMMRLEPGDKA